jgi:hypothetical protein
MTALVIRLVASLARRSLVAERLAARILPVPVDVRRA